MTWADRFILVALLIQVSFALVNVTGIFPVEATIAGFDSDNIAEMMNNVEQKSENLGGVIDYFSLLGTMALLGLQVIVTFAVSVFGAFPTIFKIFLIPDAIANILGGVIDILVLLGLATKLLNRG
ncbi:hypothetical protein J2755_000294 [Methanohalophilus levihalophilus]|uniref:hypothetical protein n=1 Tax=Methanohalophilus levihalophilus TaxID=1431282 RepID=UPI001AE24C38|nr:hypothetical protein [Methanohalophilus levihalophilus]MBP2029374.1 hypothetical protein [Methanohalophilus levihalophilus]